MADRETIEMYQRMWNVMKMTAKEIGKEVGKGRNSVVGVINRAKSAGWYFESRAPEPIANRKPVRAKVVGVNGTKVIKKRRLNKTPTKPAVPSEITILELEAHHCKAVIGHSQKRGLPVYCGGERLEGKPYCQQHSEAYLPRQ